MCDPKSRKPLSRCSKHQDCSKSSCCNRCLVLQVKARSGAEMSRNLQWWDVIALGVGGMVGAGVFVSTGIAAHNFAGPALFLSYFVAGISALLSALCYTEFAVEMPVAGGAFSYLRITFGTFPIPQHFCATFRPLLEKQSAIYFASFRGLLRVSTGVRGESKFVQRAADFLRDGYAVINDG